MYSDYAIRTLLASNHHLEAPTSLVDYTVDFIHAGLDYFFDSDSVRTHPSELPHQDLAELVSDAHDYLLHSASAPLERLRAANVSPQAAGQTWVAIRCGHGHEGTIYSAAMADDARAYGDIDIP